MPREFSRRFPQANVFYPCNRPNPRSPLSGDGGRFAQLPPDPMPRPDSLQDVLTLLRHSRVVDDVRLGGFLARLDDDGTAETKAVDTPPGGPREPFSASDLLGRMVVEGLLTRYQ